MVRRWIGALVVVLGVAVPLGLADDGTERRAGEAAGVTCARTVFAAPILRVGVDGMWFARATQRRPGPSSSDSTAKRS